MNLLKYEFSKVFGMKFPIIITLFFLLLNAILCFYQTTSYDSAYIDGASKFFSEHKNDSEIELSEFESNISSDFLTSEDMPDHAKYYYDFIDFSNYISDYSFKLDNIKKQAGLYIYELSARGVSDTSYIIKLQHEVIDIYDMAQDSIKINFEYIKGWDVYFTYNIVNVFVFISTLLFSVTIFTHEKTSGMHYIIHTTANGYMKIIGAKIFCTIIIIFSLFFLFSLESWLIIGMNIGYSSPHNFIQSLEPFLFCPYPLKILNYLFLSSLVKILSLLLFSSMVMTVCVLNYNHLLSFGLGVILYGINWIVHSINYINSDNYFKNINLITASNTTSLFDRYRALNIFGNIVECYIAIIFVYFTITLLLYCCVVLFHYLNLNRVHFNFSFPQKSTCLKNANSFKLSYHSLFYHEQYKLWILSRNFIIFILLISIKAFISFSPVNYDSYADSVYKDYMTTLSGELSSEKQSYLETERNFINKTLAIHDIKQQDYIDGNISFEDYRDYIKTYNYAYNRNEYFSKIELHRDYILELSSDGKSAWFVYDTGWKELFFSDFDWLFFIVLLILYAGIFTLEYDNMSSSGSFAQILRTTKHGRKTTFIMKCRATLLSSLIISIIWNSIDLFCIISNYELPLLNAPIYSIQEFESFPIQISLFGVLILFYIIKIVASIFLAMLLCMLSTLLKKSIPVLSLTLFITILPHLLYSLNINFFYIIDFTNFMEATPLLIHTSYGILYVCCCLGILLLLYINAKKEWIK